MACRTALATTRSPRRGARHAALDPRAHAARRSVAPRAAGGGTSRYASATSARATAGRDRARPPVPSSAMLPALRVSCGCACACASTRYWTANSMSTMPPSSCLRSNSVGGVRMAGVHPPAHLDDVAAELAAIARQAQDRLALRLERRADRCVAGDEARARQRLVLPRPRVLALVAPECRKARHDEALRAVGPQPQVGVVQRGRRRSCW